MYYDQSIKYLEMRKLGEKIKGAGFVKIECWGKSCSLLIQLSCMEELPSGEREWYVTGRGREKKLGTMEVVKGRGRLELRELPCEDPAGDGWNVRELEKVWMPLDGEREITAVFREGKAQENRTLQNEATQESGGAQKIGAMPSETVQDKEAAPENEAAQGKKDTQEMKGASENAGSQRLPKFTAAIKEGKWEQLGEIYPQVSPFGDQRRYLQISPGDFVILKDRSYRKVNNSFLLHGYFTYKHLILHRELRKGEAVYFVGVPGQFYDQEKEVAILFGFESFEGKTEPAREGDFGYYMMRVEL